MYYITISQLKERGSSTASVKDNSPRGYKTVSIDEVKPGDEVIINSHFTTVTDNTFTADAEKLDEVRAEIGRRSDRSAWDKGVSVYAMEILDRVEERSAYAGRHPHDRQTFRDYALNGASEPRKPGDLFASWSVASWGGSYLIYDYDIAARLCTPSELKKTRDGERRPNAREDWLDVQARALYQAYNRLFRAWSRITSAAAV